MPEMGKVLAEVGQQGHVGKGLTQGNSSDATDERRGYLNCYPDHL